MVQHHLSGLCETLQLPHGSAQQAQHLNTLEPVSISSPAFPGPRSKHVIIILGLGVSEHMQTCSIHTQQATASKENKTHTMQPSQRRIQTRMEALETKVVCACVCACLHVFMQVCWKCLQALCWFSCGQGFSFSFANCLGLRCILFSRIEICFWFGFGAVHLVLGGAWCSMPILRSWFHGVSLVQPYGECYQNFIRISSKFHQP